ncbi:hypothetical protein X975_26820, partial [Stegodyphus mimosarum]
MRPAVAVARESGNAKAPSSGTTVTSAVSGRIHEGAIRRRTVIPRRTLCTYLTVKYLHICWKVKVPCLKPLLTIQS